MVYFIRFYIKVEFSIENMCKWVGWTEINDRGSKSVTRETKAGHSWLPTLCFQRRLCGSWQAGLQMLMFGALWSLNRLDSSHVYNYYIIYMMITIMYFHNYIYVFYHLKWAVAHCGFKLKTGFFMSVAAWTGPAVEILREFRWWISPSSSCSLPVVILGALVIGSTCFCAGFAGACCLVSASCRSWLFHCISGAYQLWGHPFQQRGSLALRQRFWEYRAWAAAALASRGFGLALIFHGPLLHLWGHQTLLYHRWPPNFANLCPRHFRGHLRPLRRINHWLLRLTWLFATRCGWWTSSWIKSLCTFCWLQLASRLWGNCAPRFWTTTWTILHWGTTVIGLLLLGLLGHCELEFQLVGFWLVLSTNKPGL